MTTSTPVTDAKAPEVTKSLETAGLQFEAADAAPAEDVHVHGPDCSHGHHHHHHAAGVTYVRETPKLGRNEPCSCGSGQKFKKCCGK